MPHQVLGQMLQRKFDHDIRRHYFRGMEFAEPAGDPGWFGPGSAVWHVHSHTEALIFGLQCAAYIERLDPSIYWMGMHHSRLVKRDEQGNAIPVIDPKGAAVRLGHSIAFFIGTAYGNTETAERVSRAVRSMHHTIKGTRPDGATYDADDPDWLRWNYATVVWGIASAHERYHVRPLDDIDDYYRAFVRVGEALGGTDLPRTKGEVLECLEERVPKLALTFIGASRTFPALGEGLPAGQKPLFWLLDWAEKDLLPEWGQKMFLYKAPNPIRVHARRQVVKLALNGLHATTGPMREFRQSQARAAGVLGDVPETTAPIGADEPMDRRAVEATF